MSAQDPLEAPGTLKAALWRSGAGEEGGFLEPSRKGGTREGIVVLRVTGGLREAQRGDSGGLGKPLQSNI